MLVELKSVKGVVREDQKAVQGDLERAGTIVFIARSMDDLESIVATLKMGRAA